MKNFQMGASISRRNNQLSHPYFSKYLIVTITFSLAKSLSKVGLPIHFVCKGLDKEYEFTSSLHQ